MMEDRKEIVETERGRFKLEIWETNKGPTLGYVRWGVYVSLPIGDRRWWYELDGTGKGYTTLDRAEGEGARTLDYWSKNYNPETNDDTPIKVPPVVAEVAAINGLTLDEQARLEREWRADGIVPLRKDETDYTCPGCGTYTNFEDEDNLLGRWNFRGYVGERDWLELWHCPTCGTRYILRNGEA